MNLTHVHYHHSIKTATATFQLEGGGEKVPNLVANCERHDSAETANKSNRIKSERNRETERERERTMIIPRIMEK